MTTDCRLASDEKCFSIQERDAYETYIRKRSSKEIRIARASINPNEELCTYKKYTGATKKPKRIKGKKGRLTVGDDIHEH